MARNNPKKKTESDDANRDAYAVVGELVMIANAIDFQLNNILITVLNLGSALMLQPVVATLDPSKKVEILKERAKHISNAEWKNGLISYCNKVESVSRSRNIVGHTPAVHQDGIWTFKPVAAAKLLKGIDIESKSLRSTTINELKEAIKVGEATLGMGVDLEENFKRFNAAAITKSRK